MKRTLLLIALVAVLTAAAFVLRGGGRLPETPGDTVNALFDAAKKGDGAAYLRLTTGELRKTLEKTRAEQGAEAALDARFEQRHEGAAAFEKALDRGDGFVAFSRKKQFLNTLRLFGEAHARH